MSTVLLADTRDAINDSDSNALPTFNANVTNPNAITYSHEYAHSLDYRLKEWCKQIPAEKLLYLDLNDTRSTYDIPFMHKRCPSEMSIGDIKLKVGRNKRHRDDRGFWTAMHLCYYNSDEKELDTISIVDPTSTYKTAIKRLCTGDQWMRLLQGSSTISAALRIAKAAEIFRRESPRSYTNLLGELFAMS